MLPFLLTCRCSFCFSLDLEIGLYFAHSKFNRTGRYVLFSDVSFIARGVLSKDWVLNGSMGDVHVLGRTTV
jgi:hypothetical protein